MQNLARVALLEIPKDGTDERGRHNFEATKEKTPPSRQSPVSTKKETHTQSGHPSKTKRRRRNWDVNFGTPPRGSPQHNQRKERKDPLPLRYPHTGTSTGTSREKTPTNQQGRLSTPTDPEGTGSTALPPIESSKDTTEVDGGRETKKEPGP